VEQNFVSSISDEPLIKGAKSFFSTVKSYH
jgi:hypothetical protein